MKAPIGLSQQAGVQMNLRAASMAFSENFFSFFKNIITFFCEKLDWGKKRILTWASKELKTKYKLMSHGSFKGKILFCVAR